MGHDNYPTWAILILFWVATAYSLAQPQKVENPGTGAAESSVQKIEIISVLQKIIEARSKQAEKELKRLEKKHDVETQETEEEIQHRLQLEFKLTGSFSTKYTAKVDRDESDHDLLNVLSLEMEHLIPETLHFNMQGAILSDLGGGQYQSTLPSKDFRDIYDSYIYSSQGRLYQAYFTLENLWDSRSRIYLGRQEIYLDRAYYLDGAVARLKLFDFLEISGFGGLSVYDFKGSKGEDWLAGGGISVSPFEGGRLSFHYIHLSENSKDEGLHDDIYLIEARQKLLEYINFIGYFTIISEKAGDLDLKIDFYYPTVDLQIRARGHILINQVNRVTTNVDTFTTFMVVEQPYQLLNFNISKCFGENWNMEVGYTGRRLDHSRDRGAFNREYNQIYVTASTRNLEWEGFSLSFSGELWLAEDGDYFYGVDFEAGYCAGEKWKASAGVDYSLYKYDYYTQKEKTDVYTLFASMHYRVSYYLEIKGKYECELYESDNVHIISLEAKVGF